MDVEPKQRYTLHKEERLKSRKAIDQLFAQGRSFSSFPLRVIHLDVTASAPAFSKSNVQAAFSVSKKYFKKAVDRNRIRRLMKEAYRLKKNELQEQLKKQQKHLVVFFIYTGNELPKYQPVFDKMGSALLRLIKIVHENSLADT